MRDPFLLPCKNIWFEKYIVWVTLLRSTFEVDGNGQESYTGQWTQQNTTSTWGRLFPSFGGVLMVKPRKWYEFEEILFPLRMFWWQRQWSQVAERDIFVPSRPSDVMIVKLTYHLADKLTKSAWKNLYINLWNAPFFPFSFCSAIGIRSPGSNYLHGKRCWVSENIIGYILHMEKDKEQDCPKLLALCELFQMSTLLLKL